MNASNRGWLICGLLGAAAIASTLAVMMSWNAETATISLDRALANCDSLDITFLYGRDLAPSMSLADRQTIERIRQLLRLTEAEPRDREGAIAAKPFVKVRVLRGKSELASFQVVGNVLFIPGEPSASQQAFHLSSVKAWIELYELEDSGDGVDRTKHD